jgi:hypothetical protein
MYVRIPTWFPFTIQVYINSHDWLARKLDQHAMPYCEENMPSWGFVTATSSTGSSLSSKTLQRYDVWVSGFRVS